jgi:hypothetical protein
MITRKWKSEFILLETMDKFDHENGADIFSLTEVYMPAVTRDVDAHYKAMRYWVKKNRTRNPSYPKKSMTRLELYKSFPSALTSLTDEEISTLLRVGEAYYAAQPQGIGSPPGRQIDPLHAFPAAAAARKSYIASFRNSSELTLAEEYIIHRTFTRVYVQTGDIDLTTDRTFTELLNFVDEFSLI